MDLFEKIAKNKGPLGKYASVAHGYFAFPKLRGVIGPKMIFNGKEVLTWSLNNYLGLANHPEVRTADNEGTRKYGLATPMGARMMSGNSDLIEELEKKLSIFVKHEDTMLMNYGYQGILSIIDALLDRHDVVIYDSESHASIVDGVRLHQGHRFVYPHNSIGHLEKLLMRASKLVKKSNGAILVITEGVFGMAGDMGKLKEIVELKKQFNFRLLIDDAHGFGTMGNSGAGTPEFQNVQSGVDIYFSTFAKSMAGIGAFVSSKKEIVEFLRYNTRSQIFAKTLPSPMVFGLIKRLEILINKPELRTDLWAVVKTLQSGLVDRGFNIGRTESPITPVFLSGTTSEAAQMIIDLRENHNIFCSIVVYPVVPKDVMMLRLIPTAEHSFKDTMYTLEVFEKISKKLKEGAYSKESFSVPQQQV